MDYIKNKYTYKIHSKILAADARIFLFVIYLQHWKDKRKEKIFAWESPE